MAIDHQPLMSGRIGHDTRHRERDVDPGASAGLGKNRGVSDGKTFCLARDVQIMLTDREGLPLPPRRPRPNSLTKGSVLAVVFRPRNRAVAGAARFGWADRGPVAPHHFGEHLPGLVTRPP
jgi:hypothetical protein